MASVLAAGATGTDLTLSGRSTAAGFTSSIKGTVSLPSFNWTDDPDCGPYLSTVANRWELAAGGADVASVRTALLHAYVLMTHATTASFAAKIATSVVTPTALAANTNDWGGPGSATHIRASASGAFNLTGLLAGEGGEIRVLNNVGSFNITITHEDALSTAANRFTTSTGASLVLTPDDFAILMYDATTSRWRVALV